MYHFIHSLEDRGTHCETTPPLTNLVGEQNKVIPTYQGREMSILGVAEDGLRLYAGTKYLCHTNKLPLNLVNFQKKATFQGCPFLGGRGKKMLWGGAGGI